MTRSADSRRWQKPLLNAGVGAARALSGAVRRGLSDDRLPLPPGSVMEREIKGGETHSFQIQAIPGQLIHAQVDQKGADVRVTLIGPNERELALSDFPNANWG